MYTKFHSQLTSDTPLWTTCATVTAARQPHRPRDAVVAPLDDHLRPPADASHPPEEAVGVDQLVAAHCVEGPTHAGPDPGGGLVLYVCERDLQFQTSQIIHSQHYKMIHDGMYHQSCADIGLISTLSDIQG